MMYLLVGRRNYTTPKDQDTFYSFYFNDNINEIKIGLFESKINSKVLYL